MRHVEVVVVGAGPAGLSAAISAAEMGAEVMVIEEGNLPGGQIYSQAPDKFQLNSKNLSYDEIQGKHLLEKAYSFPIEFLTEALVFGIFDGRKLSVMKRSEEIEIWAKTLILAPGAYERPVPFPGWTLPGVMTAGGVQKMIKTQWLIPGQRFLLAGTGPLQLVLAKQLIESGAEVSGIVDASSWRGSWKYLPQMLSEPGVLFQGMRYLWDVKSAKIPFLKSHAIIRAEGNGQVEAAITANVDENWHPIPDTERRWDVDTVCLGYGFISSIELAVLAGCRVRYESKWDSWVPEIDREMRSSIAGIYIAGDGAGLGGVLVATQEGHIAGINAARELGYSIKSDVYHHKKLDKLRKFRAALDELWKFKTGLYDVITDDTIICRCEEVKYSEIKKVIADGAVDLNEIKSLTRAGQGMCQGRMCGINVAHILAKTNGMTMDQYTVRPPIKPVPIDILINDKND